jgi:hypothetical protein
VWDQAKFTDAVLRHEGWRQTAPVLTKAEIDEFTSQATELLAEEGWQSRSMARMTLQRRRAKQMTAGLWRLPSALFRS